MQVFEKMQPILFLGSELPISNSNSLTKKQHTSYERIINWLLFFWRAPQAALLRFEEVKQNQLFGNMVFHS